MKDVIVIGAGVIGCSVARELSRFDLDVLVLEKEDDVSCGTSKANSGLVHAGFDAHPGSKKAHYNVRGAQMMESVCRDLDVPYKKNGALVVAFSKEEETKLHDLLQQGIENGVEKLRIIDREELHKIEPNLQPEASAALYAEDAALVCPYTLTLAMAENAAVNGVEFRFEKAVKTIKSVEQKGNRYYEVTALDGEVFESKAIVNCAGVYSDEIHNMVSMMKYHITARRGEYCLLDSSAGNLVKATIFQVPGPMGKGILVTPTVHGNILLGPTAMDIEAKDDTATTTEGINMVKAGVLRSVKDLPLKDVITGFSGLRAHEAGGDFIIEECADATGFFDAVGIESPGLSSAPAIGEDLAHMVAKYLKAGQKPGFIGVRRGITCFRELSDENKNKLIKADKAYANVICRCELITEGEILEAIHRPLGATSIDGVKRRTRAGMGRCQSGFCMPRVAEILARELKMPLEAVTKKGSGSEILLGHNKEYEA